MKKKEKDESEEDREEEEKEKKEEEKKSRKIGRKRGVTERRNECRERGKKCLFLSGLAFLLIRVTNVANS